MAQLSNEEKTCVPTNYAAQKGEEKQSKRTGVRFAIPELKIRYECLPDLTKADEDAIFFFNNNLKAFKIYEDYNKYRFCNLMLIKDDRYVHAVESPL